MALLGSGEHCVHTSINSVCLSFTTLSWSQKPRGRHGDSLIPSLGAGLSPDLEAHVVGEGVPLQGLYCLLWASASGGLRSSHARAPGGLSLLGRFELCVGEGARCLLMADFHTESGLWFT